MSKKEKGGELVATGHKKSTPKGVKKDLSEIKMRFAKARQIDRERRYG